MIEFKNKDGKYHRIDGPAVEYTNGDKKWYINGKLHRENGPAVELTNGNKHWYINGIRNRIDGPAVEYADGHKSWYILGYFFNKKPTFKDMIMVIISERYNIDYYLG